MSMADHMAADGFKELGYQYINIDVSCFSAILCLSSWGVCLQDCWAAKERDSNGKLQPDSKRFPHGIKYLADYVSSQCI